MINFLIVLFGLTILYVAATTRLEAHIKMLAAQGLILFIISLLDFREMPGLNFALIALEALVLKAIVIPLFLRQVIRRNEIYREVEPFISNFSAIVATSMIFVFGFVIAWWIFKVSADLRALYFGISISTIMASLFFILTRKKLITHVMGFCMMENGIFLLSLSIAKEVPLLVSLGILLDIFVGIFLLSIFLNKIHSTFEDMDVDALTSLKD